MSQTVVKYQLLKPKSRPNPFTISPNVVFKNGICTLVVEHDTIDLVDRTMRNYGAERVKEEVSGEDPVQTDGTLGDGKTDEGGNDGANLQTSPVGGVDGGSADQGLEGNSGSEAERTDEQGAKVPAVEPVAKLTKAEAKAGLDNVQAASYRASGSKNPVEWLAAHNAAITAIAVATDNGSGEKTSNEDDLV